MGYRMNIWPEGKFDDRVGNDHKLYGYVKYEYVKSSFIYLFDTALSKTEEFEDYLEFEDPPREAYDLFSAINYSPEMVLTKQEFEIFTTLYLLDLIKSIPNIAQKDFDRISGYMHRMSVLPVNKVLQWY